jgi:hydroxymethylglutaryl-CoA reductase
MKFTGFSKLTRTQRLHRLLELGLLSNADIALLQNSADENMAHLAEKFIENALGCFPIPLGIVPDFPIDGHMIAVPMAIEETSVIAGVNKMAKWVRHSGVIHTQMHGQDIIGQIQLAKVSNFHHVKNVIMEKSQEWIALANKMVVPNLVARGGGITRIDVREIPRGDEHIMAVVHVYMHPCNAMGANLINQVCEFLKSPIEQATHEKVSLCILSNLVDSKLTEATVVIKNVDMHLGEKIVEAGLFAKQDPYRAATHNKGVMNGIDAVLIATGNDWRAVEAGVHAYAAHSGQYRAVTDWQLVDRDLVGKIVVPIIIGTVGGVTRSHPVAQLCLRLLQISNADELARIVAAVGLLQNLAALRALTNEGIVRGHMKLHIHNLLVAANATMEEQMGVTPLAQHFLHDHHKITQSDIEKLLKQWRDEHYAR